MFKTVTNKLRTAFENAILRYLITILLLGSLLVYFFWGYIFSSFGYPGFGNFFIPISNAGLSYNIVWQQYSYNGLIDISPLTSLTNIIFYNFPIEFLYSISSPFSAGKLYFLLSTLFLSLSVWYFLGAFTDRWVVRLFGTIFYLFLPINIMILASGDVPIVVYLALVFFSLRMLSLGIERNSKFINKEFLVSILFIVLSIGTYEVFFLGLLSYAVFFIFFYFKNFELTLRNFVNCFIRLVLIFMIIFFAVLPEVIALYDGNFTQTFIFNPGLGSLEGNSLGFFNVLILKGYPPNSAWLYVSSFNNNFLFLLWSSLEIVVLLFLILFPFILRNRRLAFISIMIIIGSLFGSGTFSPIAIINVFLYLHFPGYESLNASYYWDWLFLSTLYAVLFVYLLSGSIAMGKSHVMHGIIKKAKVRSIAKGALIVIVIFLLITPVVSQHNKGGLALDNTWGKSMPAYFPQLQGELDNLVNQSEAGVAYFNPDINLYMYNKSNNFPNPLLLSPTFRTASLQYYGSPTTSTNNYLFFVYRIFYQNETHSLAQFMALAGFKFFVYLKNINSYSYNGSFMPWTYNSNVSELMTYQKGVYMILNNQNYSIYVNRYYNGSAFGENGISLYAGGLPELNQLMDSGLNLTNSALIDVKDITPLNYNLILNNTQNIFVPNNNSLIGIALSGTSGINTLKYSTFSNPSDGWSSSSTIPQNGPIFIDSVEPFSLSFTDSAMYLPVHLGATTEYKLYMNAYVSDNLSYEYHGLIVNFSNGESTFINTSTYSGITNNFAWVSIPLTSANISSITITSVGHLNAIQDIYIVPKDFVSSGLENIYKIVNEKRISLLVGSPNRTFLSNYVASTNSVYNLTGNYVGYTVEGYLNNRLIMVHEPYYDQLVSTKSSQLLVPGIGGVNTIVVAEVSSTSARVFVSFYKVEFEFIVADLILMPILMGLSLYYNRKRSGINIE